MSWIIFLLSLLLALVFFVVIAFLRDRRARKSHTSELISPKLWDDIETERESEMKKAEKFKSMLEQAKNKVKKG